MPISNDVRATEVLRHHVASSAAATVAEFIAEATRLLTPVVKPRVLQGVVWPNDYTSAAMTPA